MILFRYLSKELIPSFFLGLLIFTMVLLMDKIMRVVELILDKGLPLGDVLKLFACLLPNFLLLTLPTALLLSVLLTFSRLCADNEFTALRVSGISLYQLLPPVYLFGTGVFCLSLITSLWVAPLSFRVFQSMMHSMGTKHLLIGIKERVFFDEFPGFVLYVDTIHPGQEKMEGIFLADHNAPQGPVLYFADEGILYSDDGSGKITAVLKHGSIHRNLSKKDVYQILYFDSYTVHLRIDASLFPQGERTRKNEELFLDELREKIAEKDAKGENVSKDWIDYHTRLALPFACFVFCTIGVPLALGSHKAVRYTGFSLSIAVVLLYFVFMKTGWGLVRAGNVPPWVGPWLPNLVLGALGTYLLIKKARESPIKFLDWYGERAADILEWLQNRLVHRSVPPRAGVSGHKK